MTLGSQSDLMSNNPTTSNQWWRHMLNHKHFVMRPSSWQLQLAWQHFILQTNGKCKGSENYKFSVHVVAKTLGWAGGSQSYFAGCKRNNSWKPHCSSDVSVPECVLQQTDLAVQRKNCDRDASMECDTKALPSKNPSSKLLFNLNALRTTSQGYQFCLSNWFPLLSRTDRPANVLAPPTADCSRRTAENLEHFWEKVHFSDESVFATTEHDWSLQCQVSHVYHDMKTPTPHNKDVFPEQKLVPNMQSSRERMCRWRKSRKQELVLWEKVKPQAKCRFSQRASTAAQDLLEKNMRHQRCCCRTASYRVCCESLEFGHPFMRFSCLLANPKLL